MSYLYFKSYEPQTRVPLFNLLIVVPGTMSVTLALTSSSPAFKLISVFLSYHALLLLFIAAYRLSPFHPLARYPGPILARLSKWWSFWMATTGQKHRYIRDLHERYGDVVRVGKCHRVGSDKTRLAHHTTGPNELSFRDASLINTVLGSNGLPKGTCK